MQFGILANQELVIAEMSNSYNIYTRQLNLTKGSELKVTDCGN